MRLFVEGVGAGSKFVCKDCKTDLCKTSSLESKQFKGKSGAAYLMTSVVNTIGGPPEDRHLTTGQHVIKEEYCVKCQNYVGWSYVKAYERSQRYKEGKYILERAYIKKVKDS